MKLRLIAAVALIPLLAGCGAPASAPAPAPEQTQTATPSPTTQALAAELPIVLDLATQKLTVPATEFGEVQIPVATLDGIGPGFSVLGERPDGATEDSSCGSGASIWASVASRPEPEKLALPLQLMHWVPGCDEAVSPANHRVMLPQANEFTKEQLDIWFSPGRVIVVVGGTAAPAAPQVPELPTLDYFAVVMSPAIDGNAMQTGEVAQPRDPKVTVFDAVDGRPLALLPSVESVPIVGHAPGWVRVMLPSRRMLPSQPGRVGGVTVPNGALKDFVNRGTGWIRETDVTVTKDLPRVRANKAKRRLEVISAAGQPLAIYPANIGADVPEGPTFVQSATGHSDCGSAVATGLAAQSEKEDGFRGQTVSPIFIFGPNLSCGYSAREVAEMARQTIQLSPSDNDQLASFLQPGIEVDVVSGLPSGAVAL